MLWHQRLGHISRDRLSRLVKDEVLPSLDFTDFGTCVKCLKGKMTTATKKGATRSSNLLEIIHTDISGPYTITGITGHTSFITFIDDSSRYMYLYLIKDKSESLTTFKDYKTEVENQLNLKIKVVRSDRGGARSCKVLLYFTFGLGRLSKLPFSAKSRKLTRGVRHGRAKSRTVVRKSSWPALPPFGPALASLHYLVARSCNIVHGRA
ncbi:hypothetical protein E3N88_16702 [Mikania micrantha]|uniref:GAG-pre-integrase domain-containing protein n=1 Tax=Mikania micrantha TaxID=192012 RepID=A0A5N6NPS2_9ASTR|nr:hypothetical protein E3N88_16702 [Mikania micrantha]